MNPFRAGKFSFFSHRLTQCIFIKEVPGDPQTRCCFFPTSACLSTPRIIWAQLPWPQGCRSREQRRRGAGRRGEEEQRTAATPPVNSQSLELKHKAARWGGDHWTWVRNAWVWQETAEDKVGWGGKAEYLSPGCTSQSTGKVFLILTLPLPAWKKIVSTSIQLSGGLKSLKHMLHYSHIRYSNAVRQKTEEENICFKKVSKAQWGEGWGAITRGKVRAFLEASRGQEKCPWFALWGMLVMKVGMGDRVRGAPKWRALTGRSSSA